MRQRVPLAILPVAVAAWFVLGYSVKEVKPACEEQRRTLMTPHVAGELASRIGFSGDTTHGQLAGV